MKLIYNSFFPLLYISYTRLNHLLSMLATESVTTTLAGEGGFGLVKSKTKKFSEL